MLLLPNKRQGSRVALTVVHIWGGGIFPSPHKAWAGKYQASWNKQEIKQLGNISWISDKITESG